jgi:uncharacterized protein (DUF1501 family)
MKRRTFFKTACVSTIAAMAGSRITHLAFAGDSVAKPAGLLVVVFLRGGCDSLNLVGPANDRSYIAARPKELRVTENGEHAGLPLKGSFDGVDMRLHAKAAPLRELYDSGDLAIIHGCGLTNGTRSHFEAQDMMERGVADQKSLRTGSGWLTRTLDALKPAGLLPAVAIGGEMPDSLLHSNVAVSMQDTREFGYGQDSQLELLKRFYSGRDGIHRAGRLTLDAITTLQRKLPRDKDGNLSRYTPEAQAIYDNTGSLGDKLQALAELAKMDTGLRVATIDFGGWDTHQYQEDQFSNLVDDFSRALMAFYNDMSRFRRQLTVVVHSEFGRRLKSNQSMGTDHGHGGVNLVLGGGIKGGRLYGEWKELANENLDHGADLAVTTDYRTVLHEVLTKRGGLPDTNVIFPGFEVKKTLGFA